MVNKNILNPDGTYKNLIKEAPVFDTPPKGKARCDCAVCGMPFDQALIAEQNRYTAFKKCPKCRKTKKGDDLIADAQVMKITLDYTPHETQLLFHNSPARFRILCCGNRWGKDRASTMESIKYFLKCLNEDRGTDLIPSVYWWIIAPTLQLAKQNWKELKTYFPKELVVDVSNSGMMLQTVYGGLIEVRSAYEPESLVGVALDIVTITEAARITDLMDVWANVGARLDSPRRGLNGAGGIAIINSSPLGRNYFYKLWTMGQKDHPNYDPDFESWKFTTWDNPYMAERGEEIKYVRGKPLTYKERKRRQLGTVRYNQDYLAEFLSGDTKCFPDFQDKCVSIPPDGTPERRKTYIRDWREPTPYGSYVIGYDPAGGSGDIPAVVVIDESTGNVVRAYDLTGFGWNDQYDKLAQISQIYNDAPVAFSQTGHMTIEEELVKRNLRCITLNEQGQNKANYVNRLEAVVERGEIHVLDDGSEVNSMIIDQFNDYARVEKKSANNTNQSRIVFTNVNEPHDDFVSACYIAFQAITTPEETLPFIGALIGMKI